MSIELQRTSDKSWQLQGELTLATVAQLLDFEPEFTAPELDLDLSQVTQIDSSSLASLFWLNRRARAAGTALRFTAIPPQLTAMAQLYGVEEFIND